MQYFRLINSSENFSLQAGELGPCRQRLLHNLCCSAQSGEAALVEAIAQHRNLLPCSYRIAFQFLLAAFGKERSLLRLRTLANNQGSGLSSLLGQFGRPRCDPAMSAAPAVKALAALPCLSLVSWGLYPRGVWRIHRCLSVYPWQYEVVILKHLSCTERAIHHLINQQVLASHLIGSVEVGLSREAPLSPDW